MFLPIENKHNLIFDFVMVTGDAYVDHPSFGTSLIARLVESYGFSVGMIAQPKSEKDYKVFGEPRYAFLVGSGVVDSMVNNYTSAKKRRNTDDYSDEGKAGNRPNRALTVYSKTLKRIYPNSTVIVGGIEASLRRFAHYDYWANAVLPSILSDCKADLLIYGLGEKPIMDLMLKVQRGIPINAIKDIKGSCYLSKYENLSKTVKACIDGENQKYIILESLEKVRSNKKAYFSAFQTQRKYNDSTQSKGLIQQQDDGFYLISNPSQELLTTSECNKVYDLPFERTYHPSYKFIPAIEEVQFSVCSHRGCIGDCNFCALTYHQGKSIVARSKDSILQEVETIANMPNFKGNIHDIGGPTANFYAVSCKIGGCESKHCLGFEKCKNLIVDNQKYLEVLQEARKLPNIKRVFVRSGVRFDTILEKKDEQFFDELCKYHISGQLKVAPEHICNNVLKLMNKPKREVYLEFVEKYRQKNQKLGKLQYVVPYFISSHPASTIDDAIELALYLKSINYMPLQVQDFYPTPSSLSTTMYYTEMDENLNSIFVAKTAKQKAIQRAFLQYRKKENYYLLKDALIENNRADLIPTLLSQKNK